MLTNLDILNYHMISLIFNPLLKISIFNFNLLSLTNRPNKKMLFIKIIALLVALLHSYFMYFELFQWESRGPKIFKQMPKEIFRPTKVLAGNQGVYNGFLAAGLIWSFFIDNLFWRENILIFFFACVAIAGIYGAITASKKIFFIQALPAILGLLLILIDKM